MSETRWSIIVHGGARSIPPERHQINRDGVRAAAEVGASILRAGGSALDAAEGAVRRLEDDIIFNAGSGSVPTASGTIEMDAGIMDGASLDVGAVAAITGVQHPVSVARLILTDAPVLLVAKGAQEYAAAHGIPGYEVPPAIDHAGQHDTVGCVAFDCNGSIAAATSTGGLPGQAAGRVGDAPIPGGGFYADNQEGGVAISGDGESILRVFLAARVMNELKSNQANAAATIALGALGRVGGEAGIIALDECGRFGIAHNSDQFSVALTASWMSETLSGVHQNEFSEKLTDG